MGCYLLCDQADWWPLQHDSEQHIIHALAFITYCSGQRNVYDLITGPWYTRKTIAGSRHPFHAPLFHQEYHANVTHQFGEACTLKGSGPRP
jgi:hypothetical protein